MNVVISGAIGAGKSTVVRDVMKRMGWSAPGGFFTHWGGEKRGSASLYLSTWKGESHLMARRLAEPLGTEQVPYDLEADGFCRIAIPSFGVSQQPVVFDELGMIELDSPEFSEAVAKLFQRSVPVLAVIQARALDRWMSILGPKGVDHFFQVDPSTREGLSQQIATLFQRGIKEST